MSKTDRLLLSPSHWPGRLAQIWRHQPGTMLALGGTALLWLCYFIVFHITGNRPLPDLIVSASRNAFTAALMAVPACLIIERYIMPQAVWLQALSHLALGFTFAFGWYVLMLVISSIDAGWLEEGFSVVPFPYVAFVWQMFQGLTLYAVVAASTYALAFRREILALRQKLETAKPARGAAPKTTAENLLVRRGDEIQPVALSDLVRISGAGDYAEVIAGSVRHLSTTTLTEFEEMLPEERFLRVHRSHIISLAAVVTAEPAGNGRMTLHLSDGESITASRTGTRRFKAAVV